MHRSRRSSRTTNLASCAVATIFLGFVIAAALIAYFSFFKPRAPEIAVNSVKLPSFSTSNAAVNFTFSQHAAVKNPNRDAFTHYDSSLELVYGGAQVGFVFIPAGRIDAGCTQYVLATFAVDSFPVEVAAPLGVRGAVGVREPTMEIESRMRLGGRVRVLKVFTHRVEGKASCVVVVQVRDGSVLGLHC